MKPEEYFYLRNGQTLKTLVEFYNSLDTMSDEDFSSHVTKDKNDFAKWIGHVFKDDALAESIRQSSTRQEMKADVEEYYNSMNKVFREVLDGSSTYESPELLDKNLDKDLERIRTYYGIDKIEGKEQTAHPEQASQELQKPHSPPDLQAGMQKEKKQGLFKRLFMRFRKKKQKDGAAIS